MLSDLLQIIQFYFNQFRDLEIGLGIFALAAYLLFQLQIELRARAVERQQKAEEQRNSHIFSMQRIRLTETNLATEHQIRVLNANTVAPIVSLDLTMANIGDGPIDILCALMSARMLDTTYRPGIGTRARNVEWDDHRPFYWNDDDAIGLFSGISTTKSMMSSADQYLRLVPGAKGSLRRKDAIRNANLLSSGTEVSLKYQGFVVARGYPLGEIWRQLGGRPPDLLESLDLARLQFRALARPNLYRWRCVQEALLNLNRLVFRLALEGGVYQAILEARTGNNDEAGSVGADQKSIEIANKAAVKAATDPLGQLTTPDAWRFFLLHHMEFVDTSGPEFKAPGLNPYNLPEVNITALMETMTQEVKEKYFPDLIVPDGYATNPQTKEDYEEIRHQCYTRLKVMVDAWNRLTQIIVESRDYRTKGYGVDRFALNKGTDPKPHDSKSGRGFVSRIRRNKTQHGPTPYDVESNDGYPMRIHKDKTQRDLWLYYLKEGYLISKPFPRKGNKADEYDEQDIPADPRDLEPYVILPLSLDVSLRF